MGKESVFWTAGSPMCSEEQIFRITGEFRREVAGVFRKKTMELDSLPIYITPGFPRPNGFTVMVEPVVSDAVSDFLIPPVVRLGDKYGNPYCVQQAVTVFMHSCNVFGGQCDDTIGEAQLIYAEAQFTSVRMQCAGRFKIQYSAEIKTQYTVRYLSDIVEIEPGPVHSFALYEPIGTSVANEPLRAVKLMLQDESPCKNLATEVVELDVSLELVSLGTGNPPTLEGKLSTVSGDGLAVFSDLRIVSDSSLSDPFICRLIFHRQGRIIGMSNNFEVRVVTSMRLKLSPVAVPLDDTQAVGKEIKAVGGETLTVELLDVNNHTVKESSVPVVAKLKGGFELSCVGEFNTINKLPCSFNDTVIVSDNCWRGQQEGEVCDEPADSGETAYCSYGVGEWACARCAAPPPGSWSGSKDCTAVPATNGTVFFRNLTTYELLPDSRQNHVLEFHYNDLVIYSEGFRVMWGDIYQWDVEVWPGKK